MRSLHGIGFSATTNASGTIISDIVPKSRLAEGVGYFRDYPIRLLQQWGLL